MLILLVLIPLECGALEYPNRYNNMAETLFDMMDAFSNAYQRRLHENGRYTDRYQSIPPAYGSPYSGSPYPSPVAPYGPRSSILNGSWQGEGGEILVIRDQQFRIYVDRDNFRDGLLALPQPQILVLQDSETGQARPYEFAESEGRLILRDPMGNILRYIRIGW
ncbi:MAG: hypothetical protein P1R74_00670 [Sedimenticola sp.]|nr:hypothetical protein [Sedimenticola sp.]